jgi:hypothetical protein
MLHDFTSYNGRISYLSSLNHAQRYLEIGVWNGSTFFPVQIPIKVAVDPCFVFNPVEHQKYGSYFLQMTSDRFFSKLDRGEISLGGDGTSDNIKFDVIFIDGHHTFEQSFKDFQNSLRYSHEKTLWLIDDTIPSDAYSALPDPAVSRYKRKLAGLERGDWHGDVFKTVFAIHDRHPEISYCTLMGANPQTVLWRAPKSGRKPVFSSLSAIKDTTYYDMIRHGKLMMPVSDRDLPDQLFRSVDPMRDAAPDSWKLVITQPNFRNLSLEVTLADRFIVSFRESVLARAYRKLTTDGLGPVLTAIRNRLR